MLLKTPQKYWTYQGNPRVETLLNQMIKDLKAAITQHFSSDTWAGVAVTGGYGRGEGGVILKNGVASPHNNLDLVWVIPESTGHQAEQLKKHFVAKVGKPLTKKYGLDIDCFFIRKRHLERLPCLVMMYDMKSAHRMLLGPENLLQQSIRYTEDHILPGDMRSLMVNRATLLLINTWILKGYIKRHGSHDLPDNLRKTILKHTMKAIIGYGDALLFAQGDYHWSYEEKNKRMGGHLNFPQLLRQHYEKAIAYRFNPDTCAPLYPADALALLRWQQELLTFFEPWHLAFENWRMDMSMSNWNGYEEKVFCHAIKSENAYRGVALRKLKHFVRNQAPSKKLSFKARLGLKVSEPASVLATLFPFIAYGHTTPDFVYEQLLLSSPSPVLTQYLRCWGSYLDPVLLEKMKMWSAL